jgi:hypothetical protein
MRRPPWCVHYVSKPRLRTTNSGDSLWRLPLATLGGLRVRHHQLFMLLAFSLLILGTALAAQPGKQPTLIAKPEAFKTLSHPDCSHCKTENLRRKDDLRADDRVLCFRQVFNDGYTNDGAIPIRFFLNTYRVLSDSWGVFVYDPDAGYVRGFRPEGEYSFYGWRNGVMVMKGTDGTLYSCMTGVAFHGPKKGTRLEPRPTLESYSRP